MCVSGGMTLLLQAFNNFIQYQFEGNQHLVYVIIRRRQVFYRLEELSVSPFTQETTPPKDLKSSIV